MKNLNFGIIAHVDSGKTTLSEAMLYLSGSIRNFGRVDKGESFLDGGEAERRRGITIVSKQARFVYGDTSFTLLDTPGHSDFSAEMERTLQVMDYCVLLISASDGIRGQTEVLWKLLKEYEIPTFVFFNKMDQPGADRKGLMLDAAKLLSDQIVDFSDPDTPEFADAVAMCGEEAMESYLENGSVPDQLIADMIADRKIFPAYFGSALNMEGVERLMADLDTRTLEGEYPEKFGARVYKIMHDGSGRRLTLMKVTGGTLRVRDQIDINGEPVKINQIRLYSGEHFTTVPEAAAGEICAVEGADGTFAGQGLGMEAGTVAPVLMPVLSYRVIPEKGKDPLEIIPVFRTLEEENPELKVRWDEEHRDIYVCVMGEIQLEILNDTLISRFGLKVTFDTGSVIYAETISRPAIGVGHFEPLRHYAEVHLKLEPLPAGSGLEFDTDVSRDVLAGNWQRLILTHLSEKRHRGVLTGSPITDIKITLVAGKAHLKHTEGGDFRQATYRAVRQGLMMTDSVLLEPWYSFVLDIPSGAVGRAMTDLSAMTAEFGTPAADGEGRSVISGKVPVSAVADYPRTLAAYTGGSGRISLVPDGYGPCHNSEEVIAAKAYDPEADLRNSPDSVFCAHGAGYTVPWSEVYEHMHIPFGSRELEEGTDPGMTSTYRTAGNRSENPDEKWLGTDEIDSIIAGIARTGSSHRPVRHGWKRRHAPAAQKPSHTPDRDRKVRVFEAESAEYMLVDGYNVIFAWDDLNELAKVNIDSARDKLLDILSAYRGMTECEIIAVFDAYRVKGHSTEYRDWSNIHLVYTAEAETADAYIERFAHDNGKKHKVTVVTSDGLEQIIIRGESCALISSREFKKVVEKTGENFRAAYHIT